VSDTTRKERPILFSAPMVRAILAGRKTQTRRIAKAKKQVDLSRFEKASPTSVREGTVSASPGPWRFHGDGDEFFVACPYGVPGDRLWVRESFWNGTNCYTDPSGEAVSYWTDEVQYLEERSKPGPWSEPYGMNVPWMVKRPSIHMSRRLSRITLEITGVRVERLNEISEAGAIAEGIPPFESCPLTPEPKAEFARLWESINGPGSWWANPWVWVVEFERMEVSQ